MESRGKYIVDPRVLEAMPEHAVVMHPVPVLLEQIAKEILVPLLSLFHQFVEKVVLRSLFSITTCSAYLIKIVFFFLFNFINRRLE